MYPISYVRPLLLPIILICATWLGEVQLCAAQTEANGPSEASPTTAAYKALRPKLVSHYASDDFGLAGAGAPALLDQVWTLIGDWTASYLERHPDASEAQFRSARLVLDRYLDRAQLVVLDQHTYLVGVTWQDDILGSNYFIVGPATGGLTVLWNIKDAGGTKPSEDGVIEAWSTGGAVMGCGERRCRPLVGVAALLPDSAEGVHRFSIYGVSADAPEYISRGNLTIWQWRDGAATPLLTKWVPRVPKINSPLPQFDGKLLRVDMMDRYRSATDGRHSELVIEIAPDVVREVGIVAREPELALVDALFDRLGHAQVVSDIAAPEVVAAMAALGRQPGFDKYDQTIGSHHTTILDEDTRQLCVVFEPKRPFLAVDHQTVMSRELRYLFTITIADGKKQLSGVVQDPPVDGVATNFADVRAPPCK